MLLNEIIIREKKKLEIFGRSFSKTGVKVWNLLISSHRRETTYSADFFSDFLLDREGYVKFDTLTQRQHLSY